MSLLCDVVIWPVFMFGGFAIAAILLLIALSVWLILLTLKRRKSKEEKPGIEDRAEENAVFEEAVVEECEEISTCDGAGQVRNFGRKDSDAQNLRKKDRSDRGKGSDASFEAVDDGEGNRSVENADSDVMGSR